MNDYDIASVWIARPRYAKLAWLSTGVRVNEITDLIWGTRHWRIMSGANFCLSREYKRFFMPDSSWDKGQWDDVKWDSLDEALAFGKTLVPEWEAEETRRGKGVIRPMSNPPADSHAS